MHKGGVRVEIQVNRIICHSPYADSGITYKPDNA